MQPRATHHAQRGMATVELAFMLPVVLLLLFSLVDYGRFFYLRSMAASVAQDAARLASLPGATDAAVTAVVTGALNNGPTDTPPGYGLGVNPAVTIAPAARTAGDVVTVNLSYPFQPLVLPQFVGQTLFPPAITAGASAVVEP